MQHGWFVSKLCSKQKSTHNFVCFLIDGNEQDWMIARQFIGEMARRGYHL
jgi:hypothetical protein